MSSHATPSPTDKPLGFWSCWSLSVGIMIGSGIFLLPTVLAPYGLVSFGGWLLAGGGSILLALVFARLSSRTTRTGGPYVYVQDAFGDLTGFLIAWCYWASYVISIPAVAIAFAGYLPVFAPALENNAIGQAVSALALVWILTFISIRGLREASFVQIAMTLLKLAPLLAVSGLGLVAGNAANLPAFNPTGASIFPTLAATALLTMWAFTGLEAGAAPAANVKNAERTIPRAIIIGTLSVTLIYLSSTLAVMLLVPAETLVHSTSPFADAARGFGAWGPLLVGAGALIATAGSLNGIIFVAGQMPMAVALDRLAPRLLAKTNAGGAPQLSLLLASCLGSLLLVANYSRGMIGAFTFLLMMGTVTVLLPYLFSAAAELRTSWSSAKGWAAIAVLGGAFSLLAIIGSGLEVMGWGLVLMFVGVPVFYLGRQRRAPARAPLT